MSHNLSVILITGIWILLFTLAVFYGGLQYCYLWGWKRTPVVPMYPSRGKTSVSVIIAARNEEKNIALLIELLAAQDYPQNLVEFIIIDDHSEDRTWDLLQEKTKDKCNFKIYQLADYLEPSPILVAYKKAAISSGIKKSTGSLIVSTDADCKMLQSWLRQIVGQFENNDLVLSTGPVLFEPGTSFIEKFQFLDMCGMMIVTAASIRYRLSPMSNGANLAYTKSVFEQVKGFKSIDQIASGDDILLMEKIWKQYPHKIAYLKSPEAIIRTAAATTLKDFYYQRIRWTSKSSAYKDNKIKIILILIYIFNLLILITSFLTIAGIVPLHQVFIISWTIKILADFSILYAATSFFGRRKILWLFLPAQLFHIFYIIIIGFLGNISGFMWKGRKI